MPATNPVLCTLVPLPAIAAWNVTASDSLVGAGGRQTEMHIAMAGEWNGHPAGAFAFTGATFDKMIANFERQKTPLMIDYDHSVPNTGDTRAAGWIRALEKRIGNDGPELWAKVELTKRAAEMVEAGEYRFNSPWFSMDGTDRVTGESIGPELLNVALTNNPFIDGQQPLRLSRTGGDAAAFVAAVFAAAAPPPPPPKKKPEDAPPDASAPAAAADAPPPDDAPPADPNAPPADPNAPPPPDSPENDQQKLLVQTLTGAIDQMAKTAGADRAAVINMMADMADEIGGLMRQRLERDQTPAEDRQMSATDPTKGAPPASDDARITQIALDAAKTTNELLLSKLEAVTKRLDDRDAADKAARDKATEDRIKSMRSLGQLAEKEVSGATWLLSNKPEEFEAIFGGRKGLDKPVPIGEMQAGPDPKRATSSTASVVEMPAELEQSERGAYEFCLNQGWTPERSTKRVLALRNKKVG